MFDFDAYDNYVFDLYGTLIDIHTDEHDIRTWEKWTEWLDEHGYRHAASGEMHETFFEADREAREDAAASWGFTCPEIDVVPIYGEMFRKYGNPTELLTREKLYDLGYAFREASREYMRLFPGVPEFMERIHKAGKRAYLLSNAQACYTIPEISFFKLDEMLDDILISSEERCMKPDRAFFDKLAGRYEFDLSRTVMFGDSFENDYSGALSAGWNAIHLAGENSPDVFYLNQYENGRDSQKRISAAFFGCIAKDCTSGMVIYLRNLIIAAPQSITTVPIKQKRTDDATPVWGRVAP